MRKSKAPWITLEQAAAHQRKHGFIISQDPIKLELPKLPEDRMNKTEREFSLILEIQRSHSAIKRWEFESFTLRWGGLRYTPDFTVFFVPVTTNVTLIKFIEVKGGFIRDDAMVKFKAAKAHWPDIGFEMWQKKGGTWTRLL